MPSRRRGEQGAAAGAAALAGRGPPAGDGHGAALLGDRFARLARHLARAAAPPGTAVTLAGRRRSRWPSSTTANKWVVQATVPTAMLRPL